MRKPDTNITKAMLKTTPLVLLGLYFILSIALQGCYDDNATDIYPQSAVPGSSLCDTTNVSFSKIIEPILLQNCALPGCHASSSPTGGYTLDNYNGVRSIVLSGRIVGAITHSFGYSPMPKDAAMLNDCQVGLITSWINQGAQDN